MAFQSLPGRKGLARILVNIMKNIIIMIIAGIIKGDEIMVINGAIVSDLDMMYIESVLQVILPLPRVIKQIIIMVFMIRRR